MLQLYPVLLMPLTGECRMSGGHTDFAIEILLVEDSSDDAELMIEALKESNLNTHITVVENGEEAMACLRQQGNHAMAPRPDLILLDLHLPRMNGYELLTEIKQDAVLSQIPIVILASEEREESDLSVSGLSAPHCCVSKPADQEQFALAVRKIECFWLHQVHCC
jgi:two-component system, chemotaxis family, response regulator Rcp1